jgi:AraC family transcriptional regulator
VFKEATGLAPHRYVMQSRMERAKTLLTDTDLPVNEIAHLVGYASHGHFSTIFAQFTGQLPAQYRKRR